jgi:hypothetical protein
MKRSSFSIRQLILLGLGVLPAASAASFVVGYDQAQGVDSYSQAKMTAIAGYSWYFAHASVGGNLMDGVASLNATDPIFYPLTSLADDGVPPGSTVDGVIYEYDRGNPGWEPKVLDFTTYVNNGWRATKVDFAMNKLCFIDNPWSVSEAHDIFVGYRDAMVNLETAYPTTQFVYATMPLTTDEDELNYYRNLYNQELRTWVTANNRILFDIADIEAHAPGGAEQTFLYSGTTCQKLWSGYTTDGGHLDTTAGSELGARGFYAVTGMFVPIPEPAPAARAAGIGLLLAAGVHRTLRRQQRDAPRTASPAAVP